MCIPSRRDGLDGRFACVDQRRTHSIEQGSAGAGGVKLAGGGLSVKLSGRYLVEGLVGEGSTARVVRARDTITDQLVAVKMFRESLLDVPELVERFELEADTLEQFDHPNILALLDRGVHEDAPWFATDLADRGSVASIVLRQGSVELEAMLGFAMEVLDALQYIHKMGVIHRDVKPENVLLDRHEVAQLCDFGIALNPTYRATQIGDRMGTPSFMAPEQYNDPASVTPSADIFGLGATMYTGLTAKSPMSLVVGHLRVKALEILPEDVAPIIARATAPSLDSRYGSAEEMALELAELL